METHDEGAILPLTDNTGLHSGTRRAINTKGLNMFELPKGKAQSNHDHLVSKKSRPQPIIAAKRSSLISLNIPGIRTESKADMGKAIMQDEDSVDVDELQTCDTLYQVGKRGK